MGVAGGKPLFVRDPQARSLGSLHLDPHALGPEHGGAPGRTLATPCSYDQMAKRHLAGWSQARGLLCETVASSRHPTFLVLGLGLNVRFAPEGLDQSTAALSGSLAGLEGDAGAEACLAELRPLLAMRIAGSIERLDREGPGFVRELFWKHAHFKPGAPIEWTIPESGAKRNGKVQELGVHGELQVECAGERVSLYAEEIRGTSFSRRLISCLRIRSAI